MYIMNTFWKVKEIFEAKLEHFFGLLLEAEKCVQNPSIPDSLSNAIDFSMEDKSLCVNIIMVVDYWKTFLLELKERYKRIFHVKRN